MTTTVSTTLTSVPSNPSGDDSSTSEVSGGNTDTASSSTPTSTDGPPTSSTDADTDTSTTAVDPSTTTTMSSVTESTVTSLDTGDDTMEIPCDEIQATLSPVAPNIMLVLDKSGSMVAAETGYWDADNDPATPEISRWNSLYQVVQNIVGANDAKINFGANLFPSTSAKKEYTAKACTVNANVEVKVAAANGAAILNKIPAADAINLIGGTPSAAGMTSALNHLKSLDPQVPRAVLLITDGAANCRTDAASETIRFETYDDSLHTIVSDALTVDGIPTYVIGIDITDMTTPGNADGSGNTDGNPNAINPYQKLNDLATLGGKPKNDVNEQFYNAVNQIELQAALDVIVGDALSCIIPLESAPAFPNDTKVLVGGNLVPHVMDCAAENGWVYTNPMGPYDGIELCGTACTDLKIAGQADVNYFCDAG